MTYSNLPRIVNPDSSPSQDIMSYQESFDKSFFPEDYTTSPDYALSTFFDTESFFGRPPISGETTTPQGLPSATNASHLTASLSATGHVSMATQLPPRQAIPTPIGPFTRYQAPFALDQACLETVEPATFSPDTYSTSRTPSLCGDFASTAPQNQTSTTTTTTTAPLSTITTPTSSSFSPLPIKLESPSTPTSPLHQPPNTQDPTPRRTQRKRGRPRLSTSTSSYTHQQTPHTSHSTSSSSAKHINKPPSRLPHNQVERKYREGLNAELERLRRAVPTLPQQQHESESGIVKPSKAMVLAGAIEYIRRVERERDEARRECEVLKRVVRAQGQGGFLDG